MAMVVVMMNKKLIGVSLTAAQKPSVDVSPRLLAFLVVILCEGPVTLLDLRK